MKNPSPIFLVAAGILVLALVTGCCPPYCSTPAPRLVTQTLDHLRAKSAGANFNANADGTTPCIIRNYGGTSGLEDYPNDVVVFELECGFLPLGGKANFEAYKDFVLKNGWKVKHVDVTTEQKFKTAGWNWISAAPAAGSTDPDINIHLWSDAGGRIKVKTIITIEGPEGTDPYQ